MRTESEANWEEVKRLRTMLEQTLNREQRKELQALLWAYRTALLVEVGHDINASALGPGDVQP